MGFLIISCSKPSGTRNEWICMNYMGDVDSLAELVMQGDSDAFDQLAIGTMNDLNGSAILPYAFLMADKYHYSRAYFFVYWKLLSPYFVGCMDIDSINNIPIQTRTLALQYLKNGVDCGNTESINEWSIIVEKNLIDPNDYK